MTISHCPLKISIVTISYNQVAFLEKAILSVIEQDYPNYEYIVVDPGSTDGSRDIIERYRDRITKIVYEPDCGAADGLNKGFSYATGDIYYFINSDDFLLPNTVSKIAGYFEADSYLDVLLAGGVRVNENGTIESTFYPSKVSKKSYVNGAVTFFQQGMFFRSDLFHRVGGFNIQNNTSWDGELLLQFLLAGAKFRRTMDTIAAFRIYSESITGSQRLSAQLKLDHSRMYELVYGAGQSPLLLTQLYYRALKLFADPIYLYKRILG